MCEAEIVNSYAPAIPCRTPLRTTILAVLVHKDASHAVYIGIVKADDVAEFGPRRDAAAKWVAAHGLKQTYHRALNYFPGLDEAKYRA